MNFKDIQKKAANKWENLVNSKDPVIYYGAASCGRAAGSLASKKVIEDIQVDFKKSVAGRFTGVIPMS